MSLKEEIVLILQKYKTEIDHSAYRAPTEEIISNIEKRIDEKIQYVTNIINTESRLTIQGCQRLKGKIDAYEEMKEILSK